MSGFLVEGPRNFKLMRNRITLCHMHSVVTWRLEVLVSLLVFALIEYTSVFFFPKVGDKNPAKHHYLPSVDLTLTITEPFSVSRRQQWFGNHGFK